MPSIRRWSCRYLPLDLIFFSSAYALLLPTTAEPVHNTALVLQGGGAKGAFHIGALQALCKTQDANSWALLAGTSIGALNAAFLAQYPQSQQCSEALAALEAMWRTINSTSDALVRTGTHTPCHFNSGIWFIADLREQNAGGFTCESNTELIFRNIDPAKVQASGMKLGVPAVSLDTGLVKYFNETTVPDELRKGIVASGALVPLVAPVRIGNERFMDGGVRANLPVLHALERGANRVVALLLNPLQLNRPAKFPDEGESGQLRGRVDFLFDVFYDAEFMSDMREACYQYPHAEIVAYAPQEYIGNMLDFGHGEILKHIEQGAKAATFIPDFCVKLGFPRGPEPCPSMSLLVIALVIGTVAINIMLSCSGCLRRRWCKPSPRWDAKPVPDEDLELCNTVGRTRTKRDVFD